MLLDSNFHVQSNAMHGSTWYQAPKAERHCYPGMSLRQTLCGLFAATYDHHSILVNSISRLIASLVVFAPLPSPSTFDLSLDSILQLFGLQYTF
jgi:hypothetical protein